MKVAEVMRSPVKAVSPTGVMSQTDIVGAPATARLCPAARGEPRCSAQ
jgi:hypothetical protein